jgi:hypothetical protein
MAIVLVKGEITRRKEFEKTDKRDAQISVTIEDGERYGMYVPLDHALAVCEIGQMVEVMGRLRVSGKYLNVDDVVLKGIADVKWHSPGAKA